MAQARVALTWLVRLFLAALVVQFFLAGASAFGAESWDPHSALGFFLVIASLVILIVAAVAQRSVIFAALLFAAMVLQLLLANVIADASNWLGALHAVNALVVLGLAGRMAAARAPTA